jgi:hypothetical protein
MLGFHPYLDIRHNEEYKVVRSNRGQNFTPKEIPSYLFLLESEWIPELLNAARGIGSFQNLPHSSPEIVPGTSDFVA